MKKGKRTIKLQINFTNRWLYTFIAVFLLAAVGVGVYAYGTNAPTTFGHSIGELAPPTGCSAGQFLQYQNGSWICTTSSADYCAGGTCTGSLTTTGNLAVNGGKITVNNVQQFITQVECLYWSGIPNSDWCYYISALPTPYYPNRNGNPYTIPSGANYVCCKYNSPDLSCGSNVHDRCRFYYVGSRTLGGNDPLVVPN